MQKFSLHFSSTTFLATKLSHHIEVRPGLVKTFEVLAGFERVLLSSFFPKLARSEALKYLVPFSWNLSGASAGLNALARVSKDWKSFQSREKPHGSICPPFWILTVEWSGPRSCLFWWHHRFQIASCSLCSKSIVFKSLHSFLMALFSVL